MFISVFDHGLHSCETYNMAYRKYPHPLVYSKTCNAASDKKNGIKLISNQDLVFLLVLRELKLDRLIHIYDDYHFLYMLQHCIFKKHTVIHKETHTSKNRHIKAVIECTQRSH